MNVSPLSFFWLQPGTLRAHMLEEAAKGQSAVFAGQLASAIASATRQVGWRAGGRADFPQGPQWTCWIRSAPPHPYPYAAAYLRTNQLSPLPVLHWFKLLWPGIYNPPYTRPHAPPHH